MSSKNESRFAKLNCEILKSKELRPTDKLVFAAIMSHYRNNNSLIFPSYNTIAEDSNITRNTAIVCVKRLVAFGILQKQAQMRADGGFSSNLYTINPSNLKNTNLSNLKNTNPSNLKNTNLSNLKNTNPSNLKHANLSNLKRTSNRDNLNRNNLFKINNIRARSAKNAAGEMLRTPEQTDIEDFTLTDKDKQILEIAKTSNKMSWFELVRIQRTYYIRPRSNKVFSYVTNKEFENLREFIAESAGSCQALKYGQHYSMEIVIND